MKQVLVIACAASPILQIAGLIQRLRTEGFSVSAILTPVASTWVNPSELAQTQQIPVRVQPRVPPEPRPKGFEPDAILVAPATFNTINKWAAGIADTLALSTLCEALGSGTPTQAVPATNEALRKHPSYAESVRKLTAAGVVFTEPDSFTMRGPDGLMRFDWDRLPLEFASRGEGGHRQMGSNAENR